MALWVASYGRAGMLATNTVVATTAKECEEVLRERVQEELNYCANDDYDAQEHLWQTEPTEEGAFAQAHILSEAELSRLLDGTDTYVVV